MSSTTITAIREYEGRRERKQFDPDFEYDSQFSVAGYEIIFGDKVVGERSIRLWIDEEQNCCEQWGYFWSEDDVQSFVGAELLDFNVTDTCLATHKLDVTTTDCTEDLCTMFVNVVTDRGTLQFVAYNMHNGYYGHRAAIESSRFVHSEVL